MRSENFRKNWVKTTKNSEFLSVFSCLLLKNLIFHAISSIFYFFPIVNPYQHTSPILTRFRGFKSLPTPMCDYYYWLYNIIAFQVILSNEGLQQIAGWLPRTESDLLKIDTMTRAKVQKYGSRIMHVLKPYWEKVDRKQSHFIHWVFNCL